MNEVDCDDEDNEAIDDDENDNDDDDDSENMVLTKRQTANVQTNELITPEDDSTESIIAHGASVPDAMVPSDIGERHKLNYTEEQQIKRLRKRKRRRRRRRRRRKSSPNHITFAINKEASFNINAERAMPESSSDAVESQRATSHSFTSQKHNANMGLRVRRAILWIKVDAINRNGQQKKWTTARRLNHPANTKWQFTLWVFHIVEPHCKSKGSLRRVMCRFGFYLKKKKYNKYLENVIFICNQSVSRKVVNFIFCFRNDMQSLCQSSIAMRTKMLVHYICIRTYSICMKICAVMPLCFMWMLLP